LNSGERDASEKLADLYLEEYRKKRLEHTLTLYFPLAMERTEQIRFLEKVEKRAVNTVAAILRQDVAKLTPFRWDTEQERQQKEAAVRDTVRQVNQWEEDARSEVNQGSNWSHEWSSRGAPMAASVGGSHTFRPGHAYSQLRHISIHGWGGT
jgi:hypothetical protein